MDVLLIKQTVLGWFELSLSLHHPFLTVLSEFRDSLWVLGVNLVNRKNDLVRLSLNILAILLELSQSPLFVNSLSGSLLTEYHGLMRFGSIR
jgi:hypothetical protein